MHNRFAVFSSASNKSYNGQLARAMAKLDYDDMKKQIQKVFGDTVGGSGDTLPIKSEECLFTYRGRGNSYRGRSRSSFLPRRDDTFNRRDDTFNSEMRRGNMEVRENRVLLKIDRHVSRRIQLLMASDCSVSCVNRTSILLPDVLSVKPLRKPRCRSTLLDYPVEVMWHSAI